jgi:hypothetical protein
LNPCSGVWQNETDEAFTGEITIQGLSDKVNVDYTAGIALVFG